MPASRHVLLALAASACVAQGCITGQDVLAGREWTLVAIRGAPPVAEATILFSPEGRYAVDGGCNTGDGRYHVDGNRLVLDSGGTGVNVCEEPVAAQEGTILGVLSTSPTYAIDSGTGHLRLTAPTGETLLFEAD